MKHFQENNSRKKVSAFKDLLDIKASRWVMEWGKEERIKMWKSPKWYNSLSLRETFNTQRSFWIVTSVRTKRKIEMTENSHSNSKKHESHRSCHFDTFREKLLAIIYSAMAYISHLKSYGMKSLMKNVCGCWVN